MQPIAGFKTSLVGGRPVCTDYGADVSYGIRRREFDAFLLKRSGATVVEGTRVTSLNRAGNNWTINDSHAAPVLVGAGGHFCPVARALQAADDHQREQAGVVLAQEIEIPISDDMFKANLGEVAEVDDLVARSIDALGGLDVLVNNAGIERHAAFWDVSEAEYDAVLNVNLKGVFFATQAFVRHCRASGHGGKVINISSVHEDLAFPNFAPYCASKGALRMLRYVVHFPPAMVSSPERSMCTV